MSFSSLTPDAVARNLLLPAAEMGLLYRPTHLLLGQLPWRECVSPYTRDLTITLEQFANSRPSEQFPIPGKPSDPKQLENWLYRVAQIFVLEDSERLNEKKRVEQSLGLHDLSTGDKNILWVDSKRLDWQAVDSRISKLADTLTNPHPVWLILDPLIFQEPEATLAHILKTLSGRLASCTVFTAPEQTWPKALKTLIPNIPFYFQEQNPQDPEDYTKAATTLARTLRPQPTDNPKAPEPPGSKIASGPMVRIKA